MDYRILCVVIIYQTYYIIILDRIIEVGEGRRDGKNKF